MKQPERSQGKTAARTAIIAGATAAVVAASGTPEALAEPPPSVAVHGLPLSYRVPAGCPEAEGFANEVERRVTGPVAPSTIALAVDLEGGPERYTGTLVLQQQTGAPQRREVAGESCREVVDALAVVAAIALGAEHEATAAGGEPGTLDGQDSPSEPAQTPASAAEETASAQAPKGSPERKDSADSNVPDRFVGSAAIGSAARHRTFQVNAGTLRLDVVTEATAHAGASFGLVRGTPIPRYELVFNSAVFLTTPDGRQEMASLLPQLRIGFLGLASHGQGSQRVDVYGATFDMGVCYTPHYDTRGWVVLGCAGYGGGILGLSPVGPESNESAGFGRVSLALDASYNFSEYLHLGVRVGGDGYLFGDGGNLRRRVLSDGSYPSAFATVGLGVHF
jgi:hypothetical protein